MKRIIVLLILLAPTACQRETFDERVQIAKATEEIDAYQTYLKVIYDSINDPLLNVMHACFANTKEPHVFVLVANVMSDGKAHGVEVRPATEAATCFAAGVKEVPFPPPPPYPKRTGFPIVMDINIAP
jgi:hypothetical protein